MPSVPSILSTPTVLTLYQAWTANGTWTAPRGLYGKPQAYCTGESGTGGTSAHGVHAGGGSGAGGFGGEPALGGVGPGTVLTITVPQGSTGNPTTITGGSVTVQGNAGASASGQTHGAGGPASANTVAFKGGDGDDGLAGSAQNGSGGGGSAGSTSAGGNASTVTGGTAGTGAAGPPSLAGAPGANGAGNTSSGVSGTAPGGGASGGGSSGTFNRPGGAGLPGQAVIIWQVLLPGSVLLSQQRPGPRRPVMHGGGGVSVPYAPGAPVPPPPPSYGPARPVRPGRRTPGMRGAPGHVTATPPGPPVPPPPPAKGPVRQTRPGRRRPGTRGAPGVWAPSQVSVVNQWAVTFAQPAVFGNTPPALQSSVISLTPAGSVGGGTGYPSQGNWLFCVCGWNQKGLPAVTQGNADDIHSFWRPGDVTASGWAVSPAGANTRTSIWYTPNLQRVPADVYAAPSGAMAGMACLVIELAGIGPWDVVCGIDSGYVAASSGLNLTLPAPSAAAFFLAAACGDSSSAAQSLAPAGWTALQTVTASNGTDHSCDAVLTAACFTGTSGVSVDATSAAATDMSGVIIGVLYAAPSPVGAGANPAWPGRLICEAAFGSGYETPADECTWTVLTDTQWPSPWSGTSARFKRAWGWTDQTGIPWGLGQYQSSHGTVTLDNADGWLSPSSTGSGFYFFPPPVNANPSFQAGISPWAAQGGAALAQSSAQVFASAPQGLPQYSLQVTPDGISTTPGAVSEREPITGGTAYTASAWFYSAAGYVPGAQVIISWYNSGGALITTSAAAAAIPAAGWTQVTVTGTSPSNAASAAITVQFTGTPAAVPFWVAEAVLAPGASTPQAGCVTAGTPVRLRMALGAIGGTTYNRWYVWQRNAQSWPETRNKALRNFTAATTTDPWQSASGICPTPYRGEVEQDLAAFGPGWWWPCDDQPLAGGVLPSSLRNASAGSATVLNIVPAPGGVVSQDTYSSGLGGFGALGGGTDLTASTNTVSPSVATYNVGQAQGWMYGDPQVSPQSAQTGNPVTAQPGSAAWQQAGLLGNTGSAGWCLIANDTFPSTAGGITVAGWFNPAFLGTAAGATIPADNNYNVAGQPYCPLSLFGLATGTGPLAVLQLDLSGHLQLQINGGGSIAIYSASDLRCNTWIRVMLQLTATGYTVLLNGGLTAAVSGSAAVGTVTPAWLIACGDLGSRGGSLAGTGLQHGWNGMVSHLQVYTGLLPRWRETAHYLAAVTGFGVIPAPSSVQVTAAANFKPTGFTPDGSAYTGSYPASGTGPYTLSATAAAAAGGYVSGPAARAVIAGRGQTNGSVTWGSAAAVSWSALAPLVQVYTSAAAGAETEASSALGGTEVFSGGYGGSASATGVAHVSGGTGASPPSGPSPLGDTVQQRLERILGHAGITLPMRAIDPAALLVQAAKDVGGTQAGAGVTNITASDGGWWFYDLCNVACYRGRSHLNADAVAWNIGMNVAAGMIPFAGDIAYDNDPQRVFTAITIQPYSPDGTTPAVLVPSDAAAVAAAQGQYGPRPQQVTSYLQSAAGQQAQADWNFRYYGTLRKRIRQLTIDAASHPAAWGLVLGLNVSDLISVYDAPMGSPATTTIYRVSSASRAMSFGANGDSPKAQLRIAADPVLALWT